MPSDGKIYVVRILPEQNAVVVGPDQALYTNECFVANMHWISGEAPAFPYRCSAKTRYRQPERPCTVYPAGQTGVRLVFDEPLRAITPGQSAVLYDGDTVLGGEAGTGQLDLPQPDETEAAPVTEPVDARSVYVLAGGAVSTGENGTTAGEGMQDGSVQLLLPDRQEAKTGPVWAALALSVLLGFSYGLIRYKKLR